jgi:hypothetical protein
MPRSGAVKTKTPFDKKHPDTLAVYCSDGRFNDAVEELVRSFGHQRLDELCMPGGPALLDLASASFSALEAMRAGAGLLVRAHGTKHVFLISHHGCGYYKDRYRLESPEEIVRQQHVDLRTAAAWLRGAHPGVAVKAYFAKPEAGAVAFYPIDGA